MVQSNQTRSSANRGLVAPCRYEFSAKDAFMGMQGARVTSLNPDDVRGIGTGFAREDVKWQSKTL